jgi:hypothetical protein
MLNKLFGKKQDLGNIFIIPFHVKPLDNSLMPPHLEGAYVSCYAKGETYVEATQNALKKLAADGLHPEEILQPIHEMPVSNWATHIKEQWSEQAGSLPNQKEFENSVLSGNVVYGPFGSY